MRDWIGGVVAVLQPEAMRLPVVACALTLGLRIQCSANAVHAVYTIHAKKEDHRRTLGSILESMNGAAFAVAMPSRIAHVNEFFRRVEIPRKRQFVVAAVDRNSLENADSVTKHIKAGRLSGAWWETRNHNNTTWFLTASASRVAVCLSHIKAQRIFLRSGYDIGLFLEDDVVVDKYLTRNIPKPHVDQALYDVVFNAPKGWELLWLGYCQENCTVQKAEMHKGITYKLSERPLCLHGFFSTRRASKQLINGTLPFDRPIDHSFGRVAGILKSYAIVPPLLSQDRPTMGSLNHNEQDLANGYLEKENEKLPQAFMGKCPANGGLKPSVFFRGDKKRPTSFYWKHAGF